MPRIPVTPLKERKAQEALREQRILHALTSRDKLLEQGKREKKQKKKTVNDLIPLLHLAGIETKALRPAYTYQPKSHNLDKQLYGLLNHLFVRYPVPTFLYQACLKETQGRERAGDLEMYRQWFVTLAQGGSFPKLVKPYLTGKEAFLFLSAPAGNRIHDNVWWARLKAAGLPQSLIEPLIERIFRHFQFNFDPNGRLTETIQFYARFHGDMNKITFGEVTDFIAWKLTNDLSFHLKGRTIGSVIKLTNQWHHLMQRAKLGQCIEWDGLTVTDWLLEARDRVWLVTQLRNNKELLNEGRKQKHCVYSYVQWCVAGRSAIFSLRCYHKGGGGYTYDGGVLWDPKSELARVTIEVNSQRDVVQVRGPLNCKPSDEEKKVLRQWAGEKGLRLHG
jgi:hypothetical protein